ncbi:MAG: CPBP family intramembrane metalloprotease [Sphaerobacter sp.]|nr:CPBP family intramembrane metalloprotease [Sphaerobacter sp.]
MTETIGLAVITVGVGALLAVWTSSAQTNRVLGILLYVAFGLVSALLVLAGAGMLLLGEAAGTAGTAPAGGAALAVGLGLGLPLLPPVRRLLARAMPFDPTSIPDMVGLAILTATLVGFPLLGVSTADDVAYRPVGADELVVQTVMFVLLAFLAVGTWIRRDLRSAVRRLGLRLLTPREFAIALALVLVAFFISGVAGALTQALQPGLERELEERLRTMTQEVANVPGAVTLGLTAGIGEEILFRGAIQPRYGIVFTSLVFSVTHVQYGFSVIVLGVFLLSVLLGLERQRMGTTASIVTHAAYNTVAVLLQSTV